MKQGIKIFLILKQYANHNPKMNIHYTNSKGLRDSSLLITNRRMNYEDLWFNHLVFCIFLSIYYFFTFLIHWGQNFYYLCKMNKLGKNFVFLFAD